MLRELLATDIFKLLLVFARMGSAMMLMPGLNSATVPARARLLLAVATAFVVMPTLAKQLPPMPPDPLSMVLLVAGEATVGIFFGILGQILISPLDFAGSAISYSVGLTNMFTADPISSEQSQLLTGFLNLAAISLVFVTDTHHLMFRALVDSYSLFIPGQPLPMEDFSGTLVRTLADAMMMGFKLASPLVVFTLTFNTALGLLNRMVPQMQVFFVGMPMQILGGLSILMFCLPVILLWFIRHFAEGFSAFAAPG